MSASKRIVHYCIDNDIPYDSSVPLDTFKDAQGNLDDAKLINAFNDEKAPWSSYPKTPIPADAVTASRRAWTRTSVRPMRRRRRLASQRLATCPWTRCRM